MNREEFYHLLRASSTIIEQERSSRGIDVTRYPARLLVLGSQSILGSWHEDYLPPEVTYSTEIDLAVLPGEQDELCFDAPAQELADYIDGKVGEGTYFQDSFEVYAQGVEESTAVLPDGWRDRLIEVHGRDAGIGSVVLCLDPHDLCVAKLARLEDKDRRYVSALVDAGDIRTETLRVRLAEVHDTRMTGALRDQALDFLTALERPARAVGGDAKSLTRRDLLDRLHTDAQSRIQCDRDGPERGRHERGGAR
jgi:hypothetical protein